MQGRIISTTKPRPAHHNCRAGQTNRIPQPRAIAQVSVDVPLVDCATAQDMRGQAKKSANSLAAAIRGGQSVVKEGENTNNHTCKYVKPNESILGIAAFLRIDSL